jgi:hypothetical protein
VLDALIPDLKSFFRATTPNALHLAPKFGRARFSANSLARFSGQTIMFRRKPPQPQGIAFVVLYTVEPLFTSIHHRLTSFRSFFFSVEVFPASFSIDVALFIVFPANPVPARAYHLAVRMWHRLPPPCAAPGPSLIVFNSVLLRSSCVRFVSTCSTQ